MLQIRHSATRGVTALGWLDSRHTFSFGHYYDPRYMGVSALRVLNDDRVRPGAGFAAHGHQDMEILTYVTEGVIAHQDSLGHTTHLPAGEPESGIVNTMPPTRSRCTSCRSGLSPISAGSHRAISRNSFPW
jgi:redox-sensitive bicupin YhaK (pirin superfamily)